VVIMNEYYGLATWGILFTVVRAYYYIKIIKVTYFEETHSLWSLSEARKRTYYLIRISIIFLVLFILWPTPLLTLIKEARLSLTG
jgi:NADH:ubiquinone oxidoreductase subunit 2 (subunit N)